MASARLPTRPSDCLLLLTHVFAIIAFSAAASWLIFFFFFAHADRLAAFYTPLLAATPRFRAFAADAAAFKMLRLMISYR